MGEIDLTTGSFTSREMSDGSAGKGEVGVGGDQESGWREFFEELGFLGAIGAAEGDQGVGKG